MTTEPAALVGVVMGSTSDWETMRHTVDTLRALGVPHEARVVSAHRTPDLLGGAAHLPGMLAAKTVVPILGVPVESKVLRGVDSLLSIVQMPGGVPVGTLAIGKAGAINAALLATAIVSATRPALRRALHAYREAQTEKVLADTLPTR